MQVSLYLAHYWIIPAESYSQHYLELDSSWFAYSASGCHMGASAFIFLALYCLNKDPHCFLFSKSHPRSNKLFHWKKKNTTRQGNTIHVPAEKWEEGENATTALDMLRSETVLMHNPVLHLTASGAATSFLSCWAKPTWTSLALFHCPRSQLLFRRAIAGCGKCRIPIISKYIHFL